MRVGFQALDVGADSIEVEQLHTPPHATDQGIILVTRKVVADRTAQQRTDPAQVRLPVFAVSLRRPPAADGAQLLLVCGKLFRHAFNRHDVIDQPCRGSTGRHAFHGGMVELGLRQREPTIRLDGPQSDRAVAADA